RPPPPPAARRTRPPLPRLRAPPGPLPAGDERAGAARDRGRVRARRPRRPRRDTAPAIRPCGERGAAGAARRARQARQRGAPNQVLPPLLHSSEGAADRAAVRARALAKGVSARVLPPRQQGQTDLPARPAWPPARQRQDPLG